MTWGEALRLVRILRLDTSSQIAAALEGWDFAIDRTALAALDLYDHHAMTRWVDGGKKGPAPTPHGGRPWKFDDRTATRRGDPGDRTREQIVEILRQARSGELDLT